MSDFTEGGIILNKITNFETYVTCCVFLSTFTSNKKFFLKNDKCYTWASFKLKFTLHSYEINLPATISTPQSAVNINVSKTRREGNMKIEDGRVDPFQFSLHPKK